MPGQWEKEKWYGTEYTCEKISCEFLEEIEKAATSSSADHISKLHLPHKNQLIPAKLEVDKKEVKEPAVAPIIVRNDGLARTWYKKDDRFWVRRATWIRRGRRHGMPGRAFRLIAR
jgi:insulysin